MPNNDSECRLSQLSGMPVITLETGKRLGRARDVLFDPASGKLDAITLEEPGFFGANRGFILAQDIRSMSKDAIMIDSARLVKRVRNAPSEQAIVSKGVPLIGKTVVTEEGTILGTLSDVLINPECGCAEEYEVSSGTLQDMQVGRRSFPVPKALVVGRDALVVPNYIEGEMREQPPGGLAGTYQETRAGALSAWDRVTLWWNRTRGQASTATQEREAEFALGKIAGSPVTDDMDNLIVDEGELITESTIVQARAAGKLHQLALSAGVGSTKRGYESARQRAMEAGRGALSTVRGHEAEYSLGKVAGNTVRDDDGQLIVYKGDVITEDIIQQARISGKLEALAASAANAQAKGGIEAAGVRMREATQQAMERGQELATGATSRAGAARESVSTQRLTNQQRQMALGQVSATDILDREGVVVIKEGEIFTPMILTHLEEEGLLGDIRLKPVMSAEHLPGEIEVPRIELVVRAEEVKR